MNYTPIDYFIDEKAEVTAIPMGNVVEIRFSGYKGERGCPITNWNVVKSV